MGSAKQHCLFAPVFVLFQIGLVLRVVFCVSSPLSDDTCVGNKTLGSTERTHQTSTLSSSGGI